VSETTEALLAPLWGGATFEPDEPFRRPPAPAAGEEVRRLRDEGLVRALIGDVYVAADVTCTPELRSRAAALLVPGRLLAVGGVVGFGSAAWIHAEWGAVPPEQVEMILPSGLNRAGWGWVRVRQVRVRPEHVGLVAGLPVTSPARTAADLARDRPPPLAHDALSALAGACGITAAQVRGCLDGMPRARGVSRARAVLEAWERGVGRAPPG